MIVVDSLELFGCGGGGGEGVQSLWFLTCFSSASSSPSPIPVRILLSSSASFSSLALSSSTLMTASNAEVSEGSISSFKWKMSIPSGMGTARAPKAAKNVDFPHPLLPISPYLFP